MTLLTLAVFAPVLTFDFVPWDDPLYVTENARVLGGLTRDSVVWAFTTGERFYWHPLTWLSHMLDVQLFGLDAGWHHLPNLLLHLCSTLLLFFTFRAMTGRTGRSALVAALFAVHPLRVESVAWIAERKDVLCGFFYILALAAHVWYARAPSLPRYLAVAAAFGLGLMSKPMIVTLPFALLLLDVWPLRRLDVDEATGHEPAALRAAPASVGKLLVEKLPLVVLAVGAGVLTFIHQAAASSLRDLQAFPAELRFANALLSYVAYIGDLIWPAGLAAYYPYPTAVPALAAILGAGLTLVAVSIVVLQRRRSQPYLAFGWFWYLGTLLPVIGLVQVGDQARADRFTYVPLIGLFVLFTWAAADLLARRPRLSRTGAPAAAMAIVGACAAVSMGQVRYWKDGFALWQRAEAVTAPNQRVYASLGQLLEAQGRVDEAIARYRQALPFMRGASGLHARIGTLLMRQGRAAEAVRAFEEAVRAQPESAAARAALASALDAAGRPAEAVEHLQAAVRLQPASAVAHRALGLALGKQGRGKEALEQFMETVRLRPDWAAGRTSLALALRDEGRMDEAEHQASEAVRLEPDKPEWRANLSVVLSQRGKLAGAVAQLEAALRVAPSHPDAATWHYNAAALLDQLGRANQPQVVAHLEAAVRLAPGFDAAQRALAEITGRR